MDGEIGENTLGQVQVLRRCASLLDFARGRRDDTECCYEEAETEEKPCSGSESGSEGVRCAERCCEKKSSARRGSARAGGSDGEAEEAEEAKDAEEEQGSDGTDLFLYLLCFIFFLCFPASENRSSRSVKTWLGH